MTINSRAKGARGETELRDILIERTGLDWHRTPRSGAGALKGDLIVKGRAKNIYTVEVKLYKDDSISSKIVFSPKSQNITSWWNQAVREAGQMNTEPMLIFRHNRSKWLVAMYREPVISDYIFVSNLAIHILSLEDLLSKEKIQWVKS